jgi:hypothetical protein
LSVIGALLDEIIAQGVVFVKGMNWREIMKHPTVFISYSHDSPKHADRVLAFADQLRQDDINCILDQYETSPPEGWPKWMDRHIAKSDFVIVICTETYYSYSGCYRGFE